MSTEVYAPTVYLFAYHLYKTPNSEILNPQLLWNKCHEIWAKFGVNQNLELVADDSSEIKLDLLKTAKNIGIRAVNFDSEVTLDSAPTTLVKIDGFAYPLKIQDSYALGWEICRPTLEDDGKTQTAAVDIGLFGKFNPDHCLLPDFIESSLGQTLLLTAQLTDEQKLQGSNPVFIKELANQCLEAFIPEPSKRPKFYQEGKLFGSHIFEYGLVSQPGIYRHVLIWLFSDQKTEKLLEKCYQSLLDLFFYRNKIIQAFKDSRDVYQKTYLAYESIEKLINETFQNFSSGNSLTEQDLDKLNKQIKTLPPRALEYSRLLKALESQRNTIEINSKNYQQKLKEIYNIAPSAELSFLEKFYRENCPHYQEQIQGDLNYFMQGSGTVDKAIATIRGIVEIEQAKRDQRLQDAIFILTVVGVGIGAGGIFTSSYTALYDKKPLVLPGKSFTPHPVTLSILYSFVFGAAIGAIAFFLIRLFRRR